MEIFYIRNTRKIPIEEIVDEYEGFLIKSDKGSNFIGYLQNKQYREYIGLLGSKEEGIRFIELETIKYFPDMKDIFSQYGKKHNLQSKVTCYPDYNGRKTVFQSYQFDTLCLIPKKFNGERIKEIEKKTEEVFTCILT